VKVAAGAFVVLAWDPVRGRRRGAGLLASLGAVNDDSAERGVRNVERERRSRLGPLRLPPNALVRVHIGGVTSGYDLVFTVTADD